VQIAQGPGLGQSRRVTAVRFDAASRRTTLEVSPGWDVAPLPGRSRVTLARTYWQMFIVANRIEGRVPPCRKSNRTGPKSGGILVWAQTTDSVVANNRQFDSDGIVFHQSYAPGITSFNSFLEIRGNEIHGEYDARREASESGIRGPHGAAPDSAPPVESFGVRIAHNTIDAADGPGGAAITVPLAWYAGPAPHEWPLLDRLLVFHNDIGRTRAGISIPGPALVKRAVLYANRCDDARTPIDRFPARVLAWCPDGGDSCECRQ